MGHKARPQASPQPAVLGSIAYDNARGSTAAKAEPIEGHASQAATSPNRPTKRVLQVPNEGVARSALLATQMTTQGT